MSGGNTNVTHKDLMPTHIWIGVFGKLLVQKGILSADDIIEQLKTVKNKLADPLIDLEIDNMIAIVGKW
jgi:hypothetical protein